MKKKIFVVLTLLALSFFFPFTGYNASAETPQATAPYNVGKWLASDQAFLDHRMSEVVKETQSTDEPLLPVMREFKGLIPEFCTSRRLPYARHLTVQL